MDKKLMTKIGYIFLAIGIILLSINRYIDYKWEKDSEEWELTNQQLLETALEKTDVTYCNDYKFKMGCVALVGRKLSDENVCEQAYYEEPKITTCKAAVLEDKSMCADNFERGNLYFCETQYDIVLSEIS